MKDKKNLNNLGFTLIEVLAVVAIIALISSIAIPFSVSSYKQYQDTIFEQKCVQYESSFVKKYKYFSKGKKGTTEYTKNTIIQVPLTKEITKQEEVFVDMLDTTCFEFFVYETLIESGFSYDNYKCTYSPANIVSDFTFYDSVFTIMLENDVVIDYHLNILSTYVGANQVAYIDKVILTKNDVIYEFKV